MLISLYTSGFDMSSKLLSGNQAMPCGNLCSKISQREDHKESS